MSALLYTISATATILLIVTLPSTYSHVVTLEEQSSPEPTCNMCCQGPGGIPGVPGMPASQGPLGPPGPKGSDGPRGDQGEHGTSVKGERGDTGEYGPPGPTGPQGDTGPANLPGRDGMQGAPGTNGQKGEKGDSATRARFSGFTAVKETPQSGVDRRGGGIVTFETLVTDVGDHYNVATSIFTCQIAGYYLFTFSISTRDNQYPYVTLVKNNDTELVDAYSRPSGTTNYRAQATNSALVNLVTGDRVWVRFKNDQQVYGSDGWKASTFTGVLLHEGYAQEIETRI